MKRPNYFPFYCDQCKNEYPREKGCYHNRRHGMRFCIPCFQAFKSVNTKLAEEWTFDDGVPEEEPSPCETCGCDSNC